METDPWVRFGAAVREARDEIGIGHREAALSAGLSPTTWMSCEQGRQVSSATIRKVEKALGWPAGTADGIIYEGADIEDRLKELERRYVAMERKLDRALKTIAGSALRELQASSAAKVPTRRR